MSLIPEQHRSPWHWVPSLYFAQGIPYVVVMTLSVIMYKNLGISNTDIALYTSWLYLPWVLKPIWSPLVELYGTKRGWIVSLQTLIGIALGLAALATRAEQLFTLTLAVFWLMAIASATHDIAADGFYLLGLQRHEQAGFVGVRSTFYRIAMIAGQGGLVYLAGSLARQTGDIRLAWLLVLAVLGGFFLGLSAYHRLMLPIPAQDVRQPGEASSWLAFITIFQAFFRKPRVLVTLAFLLLYRFGEAQLAKMSTPFLLDPVSRGGLGLDNQQVGLVYGTIGVLALTLGGLLGGWTISRMGLRRCLWGMVIVGNVPHLVYVFLAAGGAMPLPLVALAVAVEQFGYGFGFSAYLVYMMLVAEGEHKTAHYAICTGFMALGMMLPGMLSGWLQSWLGYRDFFIWICLSTLPTIAVAAMVKVEGDFGRREPPPAGASGAALKRG